MKNELKKFDTKEFDFPETTFSRHIDNRVFQGIILQCLAGIEGIALVGGNFIDSILGRSGPDSLKGIVAEQDSKTQGVNIKIEVNICYGTVIPQKAEQIQTEVVQAITELTGLHVSSIHVSFKNIIPYEEMKKMALAPPDTHPTASDEFDEEYSDQF